jgi:hypothetical protein
MPKPAGVRHERAQVREELVSRDRLAGNVQTDCLRNLGPRLRIYDALSAQARKHFQPQPENRLRQFPHPLGIPIEVSHRPRPGCLTPNLARHTATITRARSVSGETVVAFLSIATAALSIHPRPRDSDQRFGAKGIAGCASVITPDDPTWRSGSIAIVAVVPVAHLDDLPL